MKGDDGRRRGLVDVDSRDSVGVRDRRPEACESAGGEDEEGVRHDGSVLASARIRPHLGGGALVTLLLPEAVWMEFEGPGM